jgi:hypothetical protein
VEHPHPQLGYSSAAHFRTSDEANAVSWLRAALVFANEDVLHSGRAPPREWLARMRPSGTTVDISGYAGTVVVEAEF